MKSRNYLLLLFLCFFALSCTLGDDDDDTGDDDDDDDDNNDDADDDDEPPAIEHTPLGDQASGFGDFHVQAVITDDGTIADAACYYRVNSTGDFLLLSMEETADGYSAYIPDQDSVLIEYYLSATDNSENNALSPDNAPEAVYAFRALPAVEISSDDGTAEDAVRGINVGDQLMLSFVSQVYPARIVKFQFFVHADTESIGKQYRLNFYEDPADAGPATANLLWTSDDFTIQETNTFINVDASNPELQINSGAMIVGIENVSEKGPWVGLDQSSAYNGKSWWYNSATETYTNLSDTEFDFNLMIRAIVILP